MQQLKNSVANASAVASSRVEAGAGLSFTSPDPALLPAGTVLCRVGHRTVKNQPVPESDNFISPWWVSEADFRKIFSAGQRDAAWAARVMLAIADQWGGDCRQQVQATLAEPLYAWTGPGRTISGNRSAQAVAASSPSAYWFPDPTITQLFIPGLRSIPRGRAGALWATSLKNRVVTPLLIAGDGNLARPVGAPFQPDLPHGRRPGV